MANKPQLLDRWGRPIERAVLTQEVAAPTFGGVRSPITGYPGDGLNPLRLAAILKEADRGDPVRYMELAETIEERDLHYGGVLGTRKRSVTQLPITVEPAGDSAEDEAMAQRIRDWLTRDELEDELFDMLDATGKGYSFTEIVWDTSTGQWNPERLEWRDPRWFRFEQHNLRKPLQLEDNGREKPLDGFKFVFTAIKAKSGLPLRSGLARAAMWGYLFKKYTERDWAIFTQTYGQPLRVGKYGPGASKEDRDTLFRAVANIAGDCAAIIPESMMIEFVDSGNVGQAHQLYKERAEWIDKQISKAVLGQTSTTDAEVGGLGSGKEHREVQEDIERADAKALATAVNRDILQPWVILERGPQKAYPRVKIGRPEEEDLKAWTDAVTPWFRYGLKAKASEVRDKFGLSAPEEGDEIIGTPAPMPPQNPDAAGGGDETARQSAVKHPFNTPSGLSGTLTALAAESASAGRSAPRSSEGLLADRMAAETAPHMAAMLGQIEVMMQTAGSLDEFRAMLLEGFPDLDADALVAVLAQGMAAAHLGGRAAVEEESG